MPASHLDWPEIGGLKNHPPLSVREVPSFYYGVCRIGTRCLFWCVFFLTLCILSSLWHDLVARLFMYGCVPVCLSGLLQWRNKGESKTLSG